jgi:hypothetical protein
VPSWSTVVSGLRRGWVRWRRWRRGRPFVAGALVLGSAVVIAVPPYATFRLGDALISINTIGGASGLLIGVLLIACAAVLWVRPGRRVAAGVAVVALSLLAVVTSNLGGFLVGSLLGLVGGALALAWTDRPRPPRDHGGRRGRRGWWRAVRSGPVLVLLAALVALPPAPGPAAAAPGTAPGGHPWTLLAGSVRMDGLVYHGIVTTVVAGRAVPVLRFTAHSVLITDLTLIAPTAAGHELVIGTPSGSVSRGGPSELLALRLTGTLQLLGLIGIPVDFTPQRPPPLVLPTIVLTDARVTTARMRGGTLHVPNAELEIR